MMGRITQQLENIKIHCHFVIILLSALGFETLDPVNQDGLALINLFDSLPKYPETTERQLFSLSIYLHIWIAQISGERLLF